MTGVENGSALVGHSGSADHNDVKNSDPNIYNRPAGANRVSPSPDGPHGTITTVSGCEDPPLVRVKSGLTTQNFVTVQPTLNGSYPTSRATEHDRKYLTNGDTSPNSRAVRRHDPDDLEDPKGPADTYRDDHGQVKMTRESSLASSTLKPDKTFLSYWLRPMLAEFFGTLVLVFVGTLQTTSGMGIAGAAWVHGFVLIVLISIFGNISGCHINPIVSVAFVLCGALKIKKAILYIIAQFAGSIVGSMLYYLSTNQANYVDTLGGTIGFNSLKNTVSSVIICETLLTTIFVFVVLSLALQEKRNPEKDNLVAYGCYQYPDVPNSVVPFLIGLVLIVNVIAGGTVSGAGLNPIRVLGPSLVYVIFKGYHDFLRSQWVYYVSQILGCFMAVLFYKILAKPPKRKHF